MNMKNTTTNTCRCGHTMGHEAIEEKPTYSLWGWILLLWGIHAEPTGTQFVCRHCGICIQNYIR
jgi:hypothetical protein